MKNFHEYQNGFWRYVCLTLQPLIRRAVNRIRQHEYHLHANPRLKSLQSQLKLVCCNQARGIERERKIKWVKVEGLSVSRSAYWEREREMDSGREENHGEERRDVLITGIDVHLQWIDVWSVLHHVQGSASWIHVRIDTDVSIYLCLRVHKHRQTHFYRSSCDYMHRNAFHVSFDPPHPTNTTRITRSTLDKRKLRFYFIVTAVLFLR